MGEFFLQMELRREGSAINGATLSSYDSVVELAGRGSATNRATRVKTQVKPGAALQTALWIVIDLVWLILLEITQPVIK